MYYNYTEYEFTPMLTCNSADTCRSVDGVDVIRNGNGASLMDWTASGDASTATVASELCWMKHVEHS